MQVLQTAGAVKHWLRRSSAGQDFLSPRGRTVEQAQTMRMEEHSILGSINAPWPGQGKGPLLGACEIMPGSVRLWVPQ